MHSFSKTKMKRDLRIALAALTVSVFLIVGFVLVIRMEARISIKAKCWVSRKIKRKSAAMSLMKHRRSAG